jgi:hypothetical protein
MPDKSDVDDDWKLVAVIEAGFSRRAVRALTDAGYGWDQLDTMGVVARKSDRELLRRPGLGPATLAEIDSWLEARTIGRPRGKK